MAEPTASSTLPLGRRIKGWIDTLLVVDVFVVIAGAIWFGVAVICHSRKIEAPLDWFQRLWEPLFTPAITTNTSTTSRVSIQPLMRRPRGRVLLAVGSAIQKGVEIGGHPGGPTALADPLQAQLLQGGAPGRIVEEALQKGFR